MSFPKIDFSLRGKQVLLSVVIGITVTILSSCMILGITHSYLHARVQTMLSLVLKDLEGEYAEHHGPSPKFDECIDEDVEEHGATVMQITLFDGEGRAIYATPKLRHRHHPRKALSITLPDGNVIHVEYDIEDIHTFEIYLSLLLSAIGLVSVVLVGVSSYFLGGRILKLNQLVSAKDRAIEELKTLTDDIAHDLRTPLTRLNMAAEASLVNGTIEKLAESVARDTNGMVEMINTMLEISQTGFRIDRTPRETLSLTEIIRQSGEIYRTIAEDQNVAFDVETPPHDVIYSGHKAKLQQLVGNLIENAFKFTPRDGKVTLRLEERVDGIRIIVLDTGCGIAEVDMPHIFQRFYRADSSRNLPGNGLGLALVQAIATSYGGRVTCSSQLGQGSQFAVFLPR